MHCSIRITLPAVRSPGVWVHYAQLPYHAERVLVTKACLIHTAQTMLPPASHHPFLWPYLKRWCIFYKTVPAITWLIRTYPAGGVWFYRLNSTATSCENLATLPAYPPAGTMIMQWTLDAMANCAYGEVCAHTSDVLR